MENEITIPLCVKRRISDIDSRWEMLRCENSYSLTYKKDTYILDMCETMFHMFFDITSNWSLNEIKMCIDSLVFIYGDRLGEVWEERHYYMTQLLSL